MYKNLEKIFEKPEPYAHYTTDQLWCDPYIAQKMLELHLNPDIELASRKKDFIEKSIQWIIDRFDINDKTRLCDFGCGPGIYTQGIYEKTNAHVTGVDFSQNSINHAKQSGPGVRYICQDYLTFETDAQFDLIVMIYCDFCALNPEQRKIMLQKFHRFLSKNGSIFLDIFSLNYFDQTKERQAVSYAEKNGFWSNAPYFVFDNIFKYKDLILNKHTIIEEARTREIYNWLQCYSLESLKKELEENGLTITDFYANVMGEPYTDKSPEMAVVIKKI